MTPLTVALKFLREHAVIQWGMCHDCDNQMCPECGTIDCDCEDK